MCISRNSKHGEESISLFFKQHGIIPNIILINSSQVASVAPRTPLAGGHAIEGLL